MNKNELKEKATEYQKVHPQSAAPNEGQAPAAAAPETEPAKSPTTRSEAAWNDLISHRIEEATRNGAFDNLPNKGKPLPLDRNPYVPEDQQMANDLLKNNNLAPHWISERSAMLATIEQFRKNLHSTSQRFQLAWHTAVDEKSRQAVQSHWQQQLDKWSVEIKELNRKINNINLQLPVPRLEVFKILLEEELRRAGVERTLG
ncbi:MAG: DUF1992 domain-containing protein [Caldilineaceae bacterium]|nr:DUF1992 domain-containing protein [Caldilineaceae bacterium]